MNTYTREEIRQALMPLFNSLPYRCFIPCGTRNLDNYLSGKVAELSLDEDVILEWEIAFGAGCYITINPRKQSVTIGWSSTHRTTTEANVAIALYIAVTQWAMMAEVMMKKLFIKEPK